MVDSQLTGRTALVTGAASGIGAATVRAFAEAGASVLACDVQVELGERLVADLRAKGASVNFFKCDVRDEGDIAAAIHWAVEEFGALHVAFNNAGVEGAQAPTDQCTNDNWDQVIEINLRGVWLCMKYEIPAMRASGGGAIINCSSIAGLVGFANIPAYVASKHGVIGLTKAAALECAKHNIRVNAVCPGVIQTPMIDRFVHGDAAARAALMEAEPIGRFGAPMDIANAVMWLASPAADFVLGHALAVDGGWVAK
ncbi:MAG: glucose 1-dehydrogenase [Alphaproteobacteria bacterium]|nr:glucose 1-dehydrogenase [Alphaproteobacteria bacterium]